MPPPPDFDRAVRIANVSESVRRLWRRIGPATLRVNLGADAHFHKTLPKLLKLASLEPTHLLLEQTVGGDATSVAFVRGATTLEIAWESLGQPLDRLINDVAARLLTPHELVGIAHSAFGELARLDALHSALGVMLDHSAAGPKTRRSALEDPLEHALATFLGAITAGSGLGFHRAALFVSDGRDGFQGQLGIGPADDAEAHRTWESLEEQAIPFEKQLAVGSTVGRFGELVRKAALNRKAEAAQAVQGARVFDRMSGPECEGLRSLAAPRWFVLAPVVVQEHMLGMVYADRKFSDEPIDPELVRNLGNFVEHGGLAWETLRLLKEVQQLARTDVLTGLLNRREFESRFTHERSRAQRGKSSLSLLVIDLDDFREVNHKEGHEGGDRVLRNVGKILSGTLRAHDVAARFGGDEFVVLLPDAGALEAAQVARRIGVTAHRRGVSLSLGTASFPEDSDYPDDLFGLADKNLYEAKAAGRGRASLGSGNAPLVFADEDEATRELEGK